MTAYASPAMVLVPAARQQPRIVVAVEMLFDRLGEAIAAWRRRQAAKTAERQRAHDSFERRRLAMEWMRVDPRAAAELFWITEHEDALRAR